MRRRSTFLALEDLHTRHETIVIVNGGSGKVLAGISKIPNDSNGSESSKDNRGVVHGYCIHRQRHGHAENDDGEDDPHDADTVDKRSELAKREGRVLDNLATSEKVDADGDAVGGGETDGGDTSEGVKGGGGTEIDAAENAVDNGGEDESIDGHVETCVDLAPKLVSRDSSISGESVGAARRGGESTNACKHEDTEDQEEETKATGSGTSDNLEQSTNGLRVGDGEKHLDIGKDEENGDEVNDSGNTGSSDGEDDGLGDFTFGVLDFFTHGSNHAVASENICTCSQLVS